MQIQSFFSRRAKCKNSEGQSVSDYEAAEKEEPLAALQNEVLEHLQPKHLVMYGGYNLCDLVNSQNLSEICRSFKLEKLRSMVH